MQQSNGDHVFGFGQSVPNRHGPLIGAVVVLGIPDLATGLPRVEVDGRIVDDATGGESFFQRCRVDKWLDGRTRLSVSLGDVIEFVLAEIETTDQCPQGPRVSLNGHKGAFNLGDLRQPPLLRTEPTNSDHGTGSNLESGQGTGREPF